MSVIPLLLSLPTAECTTTVSVSESVFKLGFAGSSLLLFLRTSNTSTGLTRFPSSSQIVTEVNAASKVVVPTLPSTKPRFMVFTAKLCRLVDCAQLASKPLSSVSTGFAEVLRKISLSLLKSSSPLSSTVLTIKLSKGIVSFSFCFSTLSSQLTSSDGTSCMSSVVCFSAFSSQTKSL